METTRILIADDDELIRNLLVRILTRANYHTYAVATGEKALSALAAQEYDLAILDVRMPDIGAIEIAYKYQNSREPRPPIIALTADATAETGINCTLAGIDARLTKPIFAKDLLTAINDVINKKKISVYAKNDWAKSPDLLDENKLAQIDEAGGFRKNLLRKFLVHAENLITQIEYSLEVKNVQDTNELIHQLAGCAGTIGARAIEQLCRDEYNCHLSAKERNTLLRKSLAMVEKELTNKQFI